MRIDWVTLVNLSFSGASLSGTEVSRNSCWATKLDAVRAEFYTAETAGHKIDAVFEVSPLDYSKQQVLIHASDTYTIIRGFKLDDRPDTVQLSCERRESL